MLTDIAAGWTACTPPVVHDHLLLTGVPDDVDEAPTFSMPVSHNDSVFTNETIPSRAPKDHAAFPSVCHAVADTRQLSNASLFTGLS